MTRLYIVFVFLFLISGCGRNKIGSKRQGFPWTGSFYGENLPYNSDDSRTVVSNNSDDSRTVVSIDKYSTIPFSPVSVDAKYRDCSGAILYNISIQGDAGSRIAFQSGIMPVLNYMYSSSGSTRHTPGSWPSVMPNFPSLSSITGSSGINFANAGTSTGIIFDTATDKRIAFRFQLSYGPGLMLAGTVDVPLTPGRQIVCQ